MISSNEALVRTNMSQSAPAKCHFRPVICLNDQVNVAYESYSTLISYSSKILNDIKMTLQ